MDSLVILTEPSRNGRLFDLIIGKLDVSTLTEAEHTDHFEMTIIARYPDLQGDQIQARIEGLANSFIRRMANDLDHTLTQRRKDNPTK